MKYFPLVLVVFQCIHTMTTISIEANPFVCIGSILVASIATSYIITDVRTELIKELKK